MRREFKVKNSAGNILVAYEITEGETNTDHLRGRGSLSRLSRSVLADGRTLTETADPTVFIIVDGSGERVTLV